MHTRREIEKNIKFTAADADAILEQLSLIKFHFSNSEMHLLNMVLFPQADTIITHEYLNVN